MSSNYYKIIFLVSQLVFSTIIFGQTSTTTNYIISGKVANATEKGEIILSQFDPISQVKTQVATTTLSVDGSYELSYDFKSPDLFRIDFLGKQSVMLVIAEGQNNIQLDVEGKRKGSVVIIGSPDSQKLLDYDVFRQESNARVVKPTYQAMRAASKL